MQHTQQFFADDHGMHFMIVRRLWLPSICLFSFEQEKWLWRNLVVGSLRTTRHAYKHILWECLGPRDTD